MDYICEPCTLFLDEDTISSCTCPFCGHTLLRVDDEVRSGETVQQYLTRVRAVGKAQRDRRNARTQA